MPQPPNILIATPTEIAHRMIDKSRRMERIGETEDARIYLKIGLNLLKKAQVR